MKMDSFKDGIKLKEITPITLLQIMEIIRQIIYQKYESQNYDDYKQIFILRIITIVISSCYFSLLIVILIKFPKQNTLTKLLQSLHIISLSLSSITIYSISQINNEEIFYINKKTEIIKQIIQYECLKFSLNYNNNQKIIHKNINQTFIFLLLVITIDTKEYFFMSTSIAYFLLYYFNEIVRFCNNLNKSIQKNISSTKEVSKNENNNNKENEITFINQTQNITNEFGVSNFINQSINGCQQKEKSIINPCGVDQGLQVAPFIKYSFNTHIENNQYYYPQINLSGVVEEKVKDISIINCSFKHETQQDITNRIKQRQINNSLTNSKTKNKRPIKKQNKMSLKKSLFFKQKRSSSIESQAFQSLTTQIKSLKPDIDSPVFILENINLGLLCYDIDDKTISYTNKQIKDMFNETDNKEIFNTMNTFRNYLSSQEQQNVSNQTSRNLDLIPQDLFSSDFKEIQSLPHINKSQDLIPNLSVHQSNSYYDSEMIDAAQQNQKKNNSQFAFSNLSKNLEGDVSQKKSIYSTQFLLKQQINELIYSIQNNVHTQSQLNGLKIKFMTSPKNVQFSRNYRQSFQSFQKLFSFTSSAANFAAQASQKEKMIQITLIPVFQNNKRQILFIVEDVTHFNQIKVLESLNKNKSLMLSQVSHEIRNPISCVIAMLEEIQTVQKQIFSGNLFSKTIKIFQIQQLQQILFKIQDFCGCLNIIKNIYKIINQQITKDDQKIIYDCSQSALFSSKLLLNLINDLLDMSQIKAGKFKLVLESFNLCDLLLEVQQMMQPLAKNKQNQIVIFFDETLQSKIYNIKNDKFRIRQILINLISNSIKYTQNGHIFIILTREKNDDRYFRIAVRDEGIGIKKEFRANLFKAFGQADDMESKQKNNPQGVGLGLMISNTIAKNLKPQNISGGSQSQYQSRNNSQGLIRSSINQSAQSSSTRSLGYKKEGTRDSKLALHPSQTNYSPIQTTQSPNFSSEEGLMLNEDIEIGSEFYFTLFNFQFQENTLKQINCETQQSRNLSINLQLKRPSQFSNIENVINIDPQQSQRESFGSNIVQKFNLAKKKSLDAFESEVNSSEEESQSCSSDSDCENISPGITRDLAEIENRNMSLIKRKSNTNNKRNTRLKSIYAEKVSVTSDGTQVKRLSKRQLDLKQKFWCGNDNTKRGSRKSNISDLESIIRRSSMLKKQYNTFFDTEIHILIVDDDQFSGLALKSKITSAFKQFNKNLALCFTTLYSGKECLMELCSNQKKYSFLFIDAQMPDMDGFETIQQIDSLDLRQNHEQITQEISIEREDLPFFSGLQIILCSGFQKEDTKLYIYKIKYYLQKPVEQAEIINIIRQIFTENYLYMPNNVEAAQEKYTEQPHI